MQHSNLHTFRFIAIISIIAALVLSSASQLLRKQQELNVEIDMKKNILTAFELLKKEDCNDIKKCYNAYIKSYVINSKGEKVTHISEPEKIDIQKELEKPVQKRRFPVFIKLIDNKPKAYCIPLLGKGLWSTLYGYLALEKDLNTVLGVTFYKHAETPGLGAEIEKEWFLKNFKGKKIFTDTGTLASIKVLKGKVNLKSTTKQHEVDGISGATLTANGVTKAIKDCLTIYLPLFKILNKPEKKE